MNKLKHFLASWLRRLAEIIDPTKIEGQPETIEFDPDNRIANRSR